MLSLFLSAASLLLSKRTRSAALSNNDEPQASPATTATTQYKKEESLGTQLQSFMERYSGRSCWFPHSYPKQNLYHSFL